ncbi:SWI/SNF and RSC complexes subunit arp9 [Psilocybe cubensis]|uniref:Actin-related protein n=2 Tax=Psilocybe cubensis TaxID=181762 RepID=A0A8H7XVS8_PSICU|nr:SWI/SNF and RSC complexes subunit arp9 [Psilocybe cubensis]KAH9479644.1 SWI/SNF and RSC complexes subunit arp9 [Psilocybe cubensis]
MSIRDANVVIIEVSRTVVRAGLGLHDLLKTPTVEIPARVGLRRNALGDNSESQLNGGLHGSDEPLASTSRATSAFPQMASPTAAVKDYLVGSQLDEALANGQDIVVSWPFADGGVNDWTQAEAIWKYVLFNQLQRRRVQNESPILFSITAGASRDTYERICQIFFERFNVAGFAILERPMAQLYAANSLSGVVVDIGDEVTDITPIYDGFILHNARSSVALGIRHCQNYVANLLRANQFVVNALSPPENPLDPKTLHDTLLELVKQLWKEDHIKIPSDGETALPEDEGVMDIAAVVVAGREKAVIESTQKKKNATKQTEAERKRERDVEAMDLITVQFREHSLTIGKERHRFCEPLFDPSLLLDLPGTAALNPALEKPLALQEVVGHVVNQTEVDQRQYIWHGLFVTGDITRHIKGIGVALQSRLASFINNPDLLTDIQPRSIRVLSVPEYYAEYQQTGNGYAAFLGSSITAKIIFSEPNGRNFVSKADYTLKGPHSIIEMTPSLL